MELLVRRDALHASISRITLLYLLIVHYMHRQCPWSILPIYKPSLLVKNVER